MKIILTTMNKRQTISVLISVSIFSAGLGVTIGFLVFRDTTNGNDNTNLWQGPPEGWYELGVPMTEDFQQTQSFGDFSGSGNLEMVSSYSHGVVGAFRHFQDEQDTWQVETLHPRFNHSGDRSYTWPVKGLVDEDIDGDGFKELVSLSDIIYYPPNHGGNGRSFPGAIYIDPNESPSWEPKPLFYGAWAENLTGGIMTIPSFVPRSFSGSLADGYHILISCNRYNNNRYNGHVYLLEQPEEGFYPYDYRYTTKTLTGTEPYNQEPFYLKRFWLYNNVSDSYQELFWDPSEITNSDSVQVCAFVTDLYSDSEGLDLIMSGAYRDSANGLISSKLVFYRRVAGDANHSYAFQEEQTWSSGGATFGLSGSRANIDGNQTNGNEAVIIGLSNHVPFEGIGPAGFFYLTEESGTWTLNTIDYSYDYPYPYFGTYSNVEPWDYNKDGFDDIVIYALRHFWPETYGDIVVFQNLGNDFGFNPTSKSRFNASAIRPVALWGNDSFNWDIDSYDLDNDGEKEFIVSLSRRDPFEEGSSSGTFKVFYYKNSYGSSSLHNSLDDERIDSFSSFNLNRISREKTSAKFV